MNESRQPQPQELTRVFVYGTLKPGETNYRRYCVGQVLVAEPAIAYGQLFALPFGYPAMMAGDSPVQGFLLSFFDSQILRLLDWLEDYDSCRPAAENEYNRRSIETFDLNLKSLGFAWAYLMTRQRIQASGGVILSNGWWSSNNS